VVVVVVVELLLASHRAARGEVVELRAREFWKKKAALGASPRLCLRRGMQPSWTLPSGCNGCWTVSKRPPPPCVSGWPA
jgi:hypothetical protein